MSLKKIKNIDRAINEFRAGRPVIINANKKNWIFFTIEHVDKKLLKTISKKPSSKIFAFITDKKGHELLNKNTKYKGCMKIEINIDDILWLKSIHLNESNNLRKEFLYFCNTSNLAIITSKSISFEDDFSIEDVSFFKR